MKDLTAAGVASQSAYEIPQLAVNPSEAVSCRDANGDQATVKGLGGMKFAADCLAP